MKSEENLILMNQDDKVLSFHIDYINEIVELIKKLEHFDKAPKEIKDDKDINISLLNFFHSRSISNHRNDYENILKATGVKSGLELSLRGHGLSFSNHFWVKREGENLKYKDINFFLNKWDDSFAKCVLNKDYEGLKNCDLNVPDITTPGWGVKGWIIEDDGPKLYKLGINKDHQEEQIAEYLASKLARRLFKEDEVLKYELKKVNGIYASVSPLMINIDEELIPLSEYIPYDVYYLYKRMEAKKDLREEFFNRIKDYDIPGLKEFFIKLICLKDLCFVKDLHFDNISLIKNLKTNEIRIAPVYDLGGAFGSSSSGQKLLSNPNKSTFIIIYFMFNNLDPNWDYSWYDKNRLIGFEDEIRKTLSLSDFYTPELINNIIKVYLHQKETLDQMTR